MDKFSLRGNKRYRYIQGEYMNSILVTGANGYIGKHVVEYLVSHNYHVIAPVRQISKERSVQGDVDYIKVDIFNDDFFDSIDLPRTCIHLAWKDGFVHNSKAHMSYLSHHVNFLNKLIDLGTQSISIMGTMHEVGYYEGKITSDTLCNPKSQYGIAKNALRESILLYAKDKQTSIKWLRGYYITGDDYYANSVFSKITKADMKGETEFPFTTGKCKYDFIDVNDLAEQIVRATVQSHYSGIINVCSGKSMSLSERMERFIVENNLKIKLKYGAYPDRPYDSPEVYGDNTVINAIMQESVL